MHSFYNFGIDFEPVYPDFSIGVTYYVLEVEQMLASCTPTFRTCVLRISQMQ